MTIVEFLADDVKKPKEKVMTTLPEKKEKKVEKKEELTPVEEEEKPKKRKAKTPKESKEPKKAKLSSKVKSPPKPDAEVVQVDKIEAPPVQVAVAALPPPPTEAPIHRSEIVTRPTLSEEKIQKLIDHDKQKRKEDKRSRMYNQMFPK